METSELRKLAEEFLIKIYEPESKDCQTQKEDLQLAITLNPSVERIIDAMLSFHEQASKDMFTTDDMLGFAEHCRLTEVLPTYDNLDIWLAIKDK